MRVFVPIVSCFLFVVTAVGTASGTLAEDAPPRPFDRCLERDAVTSGTAWLEFSSWGRGDGRPEEAARSRARVSWSEGQGELRLRLEMLEPPEVAGSSVLLIEPAEGDPSAWAWLPELDRVRRIGGRHLRRPLFGTNLSYQDLDVVRQGLNGAAVESWSEVDYDGRPAWRIEATEGRRRLTSWVDREHCVPLRTELRDEHDEVGRLVQVSNERASGSGSVFVPERVWVRDLRADSETRVRVEAVDLVAVPSETLFDPAFLGAPMLGFLGGPAASGGSGPGL